MTPYSKYSPTSMDTRGLGLPDKQDWFVIGIGLNRDSNVLDTSNFQCAEKILDEVDPDGIDHENHRFGHWACGWFEILIVRAGTKCFQEAEKMENSLSDYPILNDEHFNALEQEEANSVWQGCYNNRERIDYIIDNRSQFEFRSFSDMLGCVRGNYFSGYASDLLQG